MKVVFEGVNAIVTYQQRYTSDLYKDRGMKTLSLKKENNVWKIVSDRFIQM